MPKIYRGVNGVNKLITQQFRGVSGVNREIKEQYRGVNGVNRLVFKRKYTVSDINKIEFVYSTSPIAETGYTANKSEYTTEITNDSEYNQIYCVCSVPHKGISLSGYYEIVFNNNKRLRLNWDSVKNNFLYTLYMDFKFYAKIELRLRNVGAGGASGNGSMTIFDHNHADNDNSWTNSHMYCNVIDYYSSLTDFLSSEKVQINICSSGVRAENTGVSITIKAYPIKLKDVASKEFSPILIQK